MPKLADRANFFDVLTVLHQNRYTGPVTLHFHEGKPLVAELPSAPPTRVKLDPKALPAPG